MSRDTSGLVKPLKLDRLQIKNRIWNSPLQFVGTERKRRGAASGLA